MCSAAKSRLDETLSVKYPAKVMALAVGERPHVWQLLGVVRLDELTEAEKSPAKPILKGPGRHVKGGYMSGRINWASIIATGIFFLALWLLQSALGALYERVETTCGIATCGEKIAVAYQFLSLSTVVSAAAVAMLFYRYGLGGK
ncbi:hypothetical protein JQK88_07365 [Mesorhizobium caraganae]|uniref:hypothetical protein n=1 Tax=Mesorhizobium caraganae TaxID=483206 RepID=UPI00193A6D55|nr:hypothetical protein [Mesorhizobium caraganae]MBM2711069.1 hypothetical protein [Mesorhizobium caraganae]